MVRALHAAGIECILDIVFNHTAEGDETGPTLCFRGLDNSIYYMLDEADPRRYRNFTGCGNTLNCNHPIVRTLIMDCLRYWVVEMHVDGFRFDLGSVLGRDTDGRIMENPPILERIAEDPVLRHTKIIAEAWDAAGAYQVGSFPGGRWAEWNDRFRDDVRRFWRGDPGQVAHLATRLAGQLRPVPPRREEAVPQHQLRHLARRVHPERPRELRGEAQRGERRGRPRTGSGTTSSANYGVEGPDDGPAHRGGPQPAGEELPRDPPALAGHADDPRRGRDAPHAAGQQQPLVPEQRDLLVRLAPARRCTPTSTGSAARPSRSAGATPPSCGPSSGTGRDSSHNTIPDITWFTEAGLPADWDAARRTLALLVDGNRADIDGGQGRQRFLHHVQRLPRRGPVHPRPDPPGQGGMVPGHRHLPRPPDGHRRAGRGKPRAGGNPDGSRAARSSSSLALEVALPLTAPVRRHRLVSTYAQADDPRPGPHAPRHARDPHGHDALHPPRQLRRARAPLHGEGRGAGAERPAR